MDSVSPFHREIRAFEAAIRRAAEAEEAPVVPSCPGWTVSDLILHLGMVHRMVGHVIGERLSAPPDSADRSSFDLPADRLGWPVLVPGPVPGSRSVPGPVPASLIDWFVAGARTLGELFQESDPDTAVWTWSVEQTVGFWLWVQSIEAAVHRWDAENAVGAALPIEADIAVGAIGGNFTVLAPVRRAWRQAPSGADERYRFSQTDGPGRWTVHFQGAEIRLTDDTGSWDAGSCDTGSCDAEVSGTASDLMLYLWRRIPADRLQVQGDLSRYFTLVPPV